MCCVVCREDCTPRFGVKEEVCSSFRFLAVKDKDVEIEAIVVT